MSVDVVLATRNAHKIMEVKRIISSICDDINILDLNDWPEAPEVVEDAPTFAANALLKARAIATYTGLPAIADDSGICVDALNGMPGIFSARWAGSHGNDKANLDLLLDQLHDVPDSRRSGHFICAFVIATPDGDERVVEGVMEGEITRESRGVDGFGYDPIFQPYGFDRTSAELTAEEKDAISHRGQALRSFVPVLMDMLLPARGCGAGCKCAGV
jgi:XTP/dITP diphosphohydrolase